MRAAGEERQFAQVIFVFGMIKHISVASVATFRLPFQLFAIDPRTEDGVS
jgi:hypothetical protein